MERTGSIDETSYEDSLITISVIHEFKHQVEVCTIYWYSSPLKIILSGA